MSGTDQGQAADSARCWFRFDAARQQFLRAVDDLLSQDGVPPEKRAAEIASTRKVLADKLRLMEW